MTLGDPPFWQLRNYEKALNADVLKKALARGGDVPWIKSYTGQMYDPEYTELTLAERGLLADLRLLAARRGNKIPNDEKTLTRLLGYSRQTRLHSKLTNLARLLFLEPYSADTNLAAKQLFPSHIGLYEDENESRLEVEVEVKKDLSSRPKGPSGNGALTTPVVNPSSNSAAVDTFIRSYCIHLPDEDVVRDELTSRFHLGEQALDEAQETWRKLRAQAQGSASS